jgi:hypothetical protein
VREGLVQALYVGLVGVGFTAEDVGTGGGVQGRRAGERERVDGGTLAGSGTSFTGGFVGRDVAFVW